MTVASVIVIEAAATDAATGLDLLLPLGLLLALIVCRTAVNPADTVRTRATGSPAPG